MSKLNTDNVASNELILSLRKDLRVYTRRKEAIIKLSRLYSRHLFQGCYLLWKTFLVRSRRWKRNFAIIQRRQQHRFLSIRFQIWRISFLKTQAINGLNHHNHVLRLERVAFDRWRSHFRRHLLLQSRLKKFERKRLKKALISFQYHLVLSSKRQAKDDERELYCNYYFLVKVFRAWKDYFLRRLIHFKLYSHRIVLNKIGFYFRFWMILSNEGRRGNEQRMLYFFNYRHRIYYFPLYYYRRWFVYSQREKRINRVRQLKSAFSRFCRKIKQRKHLRKRFPHLSEDSSYSESFDVRQPTPALFLYYNRWRSWFTFKQKERQREIDAHILYSRKSFQRFILRILLNRMKSTKEATIYKRISHRRNFWLIHDTFIAWKNGFYICFLQRLKEQNALLRTYPLDVSTTSTPGRVLKSKKLPLSSASRREKKKKDINLPPIAATAMSSRRNKEGSKPGTQFVSLSSKEQGEDIHQNKDESKSALPPPFPPLLQSLTTQPVYDETDIRSSFAITDPKTPFELLSIKYFYLWANYTKEIQRLKMLGKSLMRSHRRRVARHIFTIMQNKLISNQWKNYQLIVKSNKQQQQRIER